MGVVEDLEMGAYKDLEMGALEIMFKCSLIMITFQL